MARKKNKKQNNERPTFTEPSNLNSATSDNQCNTTSTDDNTISPSMHNDKSSNRGCFGLRKPSWFRWNIFPKDGQPPTQSLLEIAIYSGFLWFFILLFFDFNRIPTTYLRIEADKLNNSHNVKLRKWMGSNREIVEYQPILNYQIAEIIVKLPMAYSGQNALIENTKLEINAYSETMDICAPIPIDSLDLDNEPIFISCTNYSEDYTSAISPYWFMVAYTIGEKEDGCCLIDCNDDYKNKYNKEIFYLADLYPRANYLDTGRTPADPLIYDSSDLDYYENKQKLPEYYNITKKFFNDTTTIEKVNPFRIKFSYSPESEYNDKIYNYIDTIWNIELKYDIEQYDEFDKYCLLEANGEEVEQIADKEYLSKEILACSYYLKDNNIVTGEPFSVEFYDSISFESDENKTKQDLIYPGYFDRFDISQGWYNFKLYTSTLDSIRLTIDFSGATDFYPMSIEPDEIGSNYIRYTDQKKILLIRSDGLKFYAKFKELENKQTVRTFFVTALISGLLIIILSFLILGLYRTSKVIVNYILRRIISLF